MRSLQQIIAEITRDAPSARVLGGKHAYACVEIPGSGGAHATIYLPGPQDCGIAMMHNDADDSGRRITFQRGSAREDKMIAAVANFLVLHEAVRDREEHT